ncbi:hypothetical protein WJ971_11720 [Achromobacter xylosoxidans]
MRGRKPVQFGQRGFALLRTLGEQVLEALGVGHRILENVDRVGGGRPAKAYRRGARASPWRDHYNSGFDGRSGTLPGSWPARDAGKRAFRASVQNLDRLSVG